MKTKYLLDTNVLSELVKPRLHPGVVNKIKQFESSLVTSSIVWHELLYGYHRLGVSKKQELLGEFLFNAVRPNLPIITYDEQAAEWHANERARLEAIVKRPGFADGQIAAISVVHRLTLITNNTKDFEWFSDLNIENWHE
ncbi:MAG: type II toxin-antitoxin system VapC family toxin [Desulfonatronovibrio sp.]